MLTNKQLDKIALISYATVAHLFATMHNPKMRGANFTWDKFPEMAAEQADQQVFLARLSEDQDITVKQAIKDHARNTGREIGTNMVNWMTE